MSTFLLDSTTGSHTEQLTAAGVSIWLDDINRENLQNDKLASLIEERNVVGVTTNPTIFATALSKGAVYDSQLRALAAKGASRNEAVFEITTRDVRDAADLFRSVWEESLGQDGRVSIEVSPENAHDTEATIAEAHRLWDTVDRPNVMIKVPATAEGLPAIQALIASGISVNVTLIFGLARYQQVVEAYLAGLEEARANGIELSTISSVASFFVSRVDTEVNARLEKLGGEQAAGLRNQAAVANARLAYRLFSELFDSERARELLSAGAHVQRPLWASTGVKVNDLPDTFYVTSLVGQDTVNTMPGKTLEAIADHGKIATNTATEFDGAAKVIEQLQALGIDLDEVGEQLEAEGVQKFIASWGELGDTVAAALGK